MSASCSTPDLLRHLFAYSRKKRKPASSTGILWWKISHGTRCPKGDFSSSKTSLASRPISGSAKFRPNWMVRNGNSRQHSEQENIILSSLRKMRPFTTTCYFATVIVIVSKLQGTTIPRKFWHNSISLISSPFFERIIEIIDEKNRDVLCAPVKIRES